MDQTPPPRNDDNLKSIMMERLSIAVAKGGLEAEEKLKNDLRCCYVPSCSFVWPADPDHKLYKQKIVEYTKSTPSPPPPLPSPAPPVRHHRGLVDRCGFKVSLAEQFGLFFELGTFTVGIPQGMMRKELGVIKFTAQFVMRYGRSLSDILSTDPQFKFLDKRDARSDFFSRLLRGYANLISSWGNDPAGMEALLKDFYTAFNAFKKKQEDEEDKVVDKVETDRRDFVVYDEYFVDIENKKLPPLGSAMMMMRASEFTYMVPPNSINFRVGIPDGGMMRKELGIIKFTALFVVRYGDDFWDALWDRVSTETEFQFLTRNPGNDRGRCTLFSHLLIAYRSVIQTWGMMPRKSSPPARMEAVLKGFFTAFNAFKKKQEDEEDEVVKKVVTDRRDFVVSEEYFQYFLDMEESTPLPEKFQPPRMGSQSAPQPPMVMTVQPPPLYEIENPEPRRMMHSPPPPHEEPEPKREKLDESAALVSEEEFLAQHPGSSTITICVTTGGVIQITVQSLTEKVGSLKEKIAGEIGIPANQHKLTGRTGVLKEDMSLAHYNLGVGEKLTLTY